ITGDQASRSDVQFPGSPIHRPVAHHPRRHLDRPGRAADHRGSRGWGGHREGWAGGAAGLRAAAAGVRREEFFLCGGPGPEPRQHRLRVAETLHSRWSHPSAGAPVYSLMRRRLLMIFLVLVGALMAGYGTAYVASDDVRYITRAGIEQTRILEARRPIAKI